MYLFHGISVIVEVEDSNTISFFSCQLRLGICDQLISCCLIGRVLHFDEQSFPLGLVDRDEGVQHSDVARQVHDKGWVTGTSVSHSVSWGLIGCPERSLPVILVGLALCVGVGLDENRLSEVFGVCAREVGDV